MNRIGRLYIGQLAIFTVLFLLWRTVGIELAVIVGITALIGAVVDSDHRASKEK